MKVLVVVALMFAAIEAGVIAPLATTLVRTPGLDSTVIQSDRLGGNFAYSTVTGHAYSAIAPIVHNVVSPVAVSYQATPFHTIPLWSPTTLINPLAPGIIAPFPGILPAPAIGTVEEKPKEPAVEVPVVPAPAEEPAAAPAPEEAPQSDDTVSIDSA